MADDNYAIRVSFEGIDKAIADVKTLQGAVAAIKAPAIKVDTSAFAGIERTQIASVAKIESAKIASESKIEAARIVSVTKVATSENSAIAKLEAAQLAANARIEAARLAASAKLEQSEKARLANSESAAQKTLAQLEKQKAASAVRVAEGSDKETARIAQETLRYKQQIAAIDAKIFDPSDIANAKALAAEINKLNLDKIKKGFDDASPVTFNQFIGATTEKARDLAEQLQNTSFVLERIGTTFNQLTGASQQAFLAFDTAKTKVATLSTESNAFANTAVKLSGDLRNQVTSAEILTAQYEILSSGFTNAADASEIARVSVIGAKAGFTDTATVADATTSVLNAYGLAASDAASIVDKFAVVQDKGKTTIGQFAGQLGKVAPIAKAAGVSFDEVAAAISTVTASGVKTESAVSGTRQAIVTLLKPTAEARKELERYGIANSAAILKTEGLSGVLRRLSDSGATSSEQLSKIFTDVDGLAAVLPLISGDLGKFNENLAAVQNSAGKADAGFKTVADSAQGRITEALNKVNEALVNLGRGTSVAFAPLISAVGNVVDIFNGLPAPIQTVIGAAIGLTGAVFTLGAALTAIGAAAPAFVGGLKLFTGAAGAGAIANGLLAATTNAVTIANTALTTKLTASAIATAATTVATTAATAATGAFAVATNVATVAVGALLSPLGLAAIAVGALVVGAKPLADAFNVSEASKSVADLNQKLAELKAKRGEVAPPKAVNKDNGLGQDQGTFVNPFNTRLSEQKEIIAFADNQKRYNEILDESKNTLATYGLTSADAGDKARLGAKGIEEFTKKATEQKEEIDLVIASLQQQAASATTNPALQAQLNNEIAIFSKRKKLLDDRIAFLKESAKTEASAIATVTDEQRKQAVAIREAQNQDTERNIKRGIDDKKAAIDRENAKAIAAIEEQNALKKAALDRKQALETEALKERQTIALQDKQRAFEDGQNAKKLAAEQELENRKAAFDEKQRQRQQSFEDAQAKLKEDRAEKLRKEDEAFAAQRAAREQQNEAALSGAKQTLTNEGKIATTDPAERDKIAQQIAEENRIRSQAASVATGGAQTQEQLVAQAKQLAQVSAIATQEEQAKVLLALDEIEKANKAKQAELDKAEDAKRAADRQASDKAFEEQLNNEKRAFDAQLKAESLTFEQTVLKPEKLKTEAELNAAKLAFERGELAALKKAQAEEERALQLQQTNEDLALQKAATAELDALKLAQKEKEIALDRAYEDQKIERERAFKESQRALDKASAIEIQQILGKSAQSIIDALAVTKGGNVLSSVLGVKGVDNNATKIPAFADGVTNFRGGMALVGERGAELVSLPRGANVLPAPQTKSLINNNSGGNKTYNVNVTTAATNPVEVASQVQRELARVAAVGF